MIQIQPNYNYNVSTRTAMNYNNGLQYDEVTMSFRKRRYDDNHLNYTINIFLSSCITNNLNSNNLLNNLLELDLSYNSLTEFPSQLNNLNNLRVLNLSSNQLTRFPQQLINFRNLITLNLSRNQLNEPFPISYCYSLRNLKCLRLSENCIPSLPEEFCHLKSLETLMLGSSIGGNQLQSIPNKVISNLESLKVLDISNNYIKELPFDLGYKQSKLQYLNITNNQLTYLPTSIGLCQQLKLLDLSHNKLSYLPIEIVDLEQLTSLNLSNNCLCVIPGDIINFMNKTSLSLTGNPMTQGNLQLSSIGDFSTSSISCINSQFHSNFHSGLSTPNYKNSIISPSQLVERLHQLQLTSNNSTPITSPPLCSTPQQMNPIPMIPSLKEMTARVILSHGLHLRQGSLPRTVLKILGNGARPCGYCNSPYVSEFVEGVEYRPCQGHPNLPTRVAYCSDRCKDKSIPSTPNYSSTSTYKNESSFTSNGSNNSNSNNYNNNNYYKCMSYSNKSNSGVYSYSSNGNSTPRSWKPYNFNMNLRPAITSNSSPLVPVKNLDLVDKLNDW